jgi:predicted enzyme related to lactoylglutathione lyase
MCDDIAATMADLEAKGAEFTSPVTEQGFGLVTSIAVPGGGELGLYEPRHRTAYDL